MWVEKGVENYDFGFRYVEFEVILRYLREDIEGLFRIGLEIREVWVCDIFVCNLWMNGD